MEGDEGPLKKKVQKKNTRQQMYKRLGLDLFPLSNHNTMTGQKGSGKTTLSMLYLFRYLASGRVVFTNFRLYGGWFVAAARIMAGGVEKFAALPPGEQRSLTQDVRSRCFRFDEWDDLYQVLPKRNKGESPEDRFLCIYDEASIRLNSRTWSDRTSKSKARYGHAARETQFFSQGRKLGFTLLVISQSEQGLDNQFRQQAGYRVHLRHLKQQGYMGVRLPFDRMLAIYHWGETKSIIKRKLFRYPQWLANYYDSWELFDGSTSFGLRYHYDPFLPVNLGSVAPYSPNTDGISAAIPPRALAAVGAPDDLPFVVGEQVAQEQLSPWERVLVPPAHLREVQSDADLAS